MDILISGGRLVAAGYNELSILDLFRPAAQLEAISHQTGNAFGLSIRGQAGQSLLLQRSTNLRDWQDWKPLTLGNTPEMVLDPDTAGAPRRFYRVK
jgi:hypothetical protein